MAEVNTHAGTVRLVGGRLCLDFINTVDNHLGPCPKEYLKSYADLLIWSRHSGLIDAPVARRMQAQALAQPAQAAAALAAASELRAALFLIFNALGEGRPLPRAALDSVNQSLAHAPSRTRLVAAGAGLAWEWAGPAESLDQLIWPILWSAADLLASPDAGRVRRCQGEGCGWLFLDTSRSQSRRWCSMEDCGNRAKARRHYARSRTEQVDVGV